MAHIFFSKLTIIDSDNGLLPGQRHAIIWTNAGLLGTKFPEILIEIHTFSLKKMRLKTSSGKWRAFWLGLNVLSGHCFRYLRSISDKALYKSMLTKFNDVYICGSRLKSVNTLRPRQNGRRFADDIFGMHFNEWKDMKFWLRFHRSLFLRVYLTIVQHWFRWWFSAGR